MGKGTLGAAGLAAPAGRFLSPGLTCRGPLYAHDAGG